ncbi:VanW family protein [Massilia glaciei]|uniref:Vancomycin resistance protein n=1 Tax=Massilia glaciei TaxID=1524097 RepID=A0A2U2HG65_9BURK|nr:VanW family protein [Massilia glaciei]PWF43925.1 vancomycin resistance protein [Massilia glaciei]
MKLLRNLLRQAMPLATRQTLAHAMRHWRDRRRGVLLKRAHSGADLHGYTLQAEVVQPVRPGALFENKLRNLAKGANGIDLSTVAPGQVWSFWCYVGEPNERNGYVYGRNLVNGQLTRQLGGGLCQLSSMLYHLGLLAGMLVDERHPHSIDIYREHERFTPLGADATVVWGFKDLRLVNPHPVDIVFRCRLEGHFLKGYVYAKGKLPKIELSFAREQLQPDRVLVRTLVNKARHTETIYVQRHLDLVA